MFTSGSTGIPKGAVYTHGMFEAQVRLIRKTYGIEPGEVDLPTFPLFALFDPALGMTAVIPDMDPRFPAHADPAKLVEAIEDHCPTNMFGSPALLDNLGRYGEQHGLKLPSLKRIISAGAPVRPDILERMSRMLVGGAQVYTPFGATESLPVCNIGSAEVLAETAQETRAGKGICVGRPVEEVCVRVIEITDEAIPTWSDALLSPVGKVGEITVKGPVVTREYYARPEQTRLAKITDGPAVVHRMGDVGYFDASGRLWMCGRKNHRVETAEGLLFTVPVEEIFNAHPGILRTALVGVGERGRAEPVVIVEREPGNEQTDAALHAELTAYAARHAATQSIKRFLFYPDRLPVDARHNAKIEREKLTLWAQEKLR